jgi:hypothetical protein
MGLPARFSFHRAAACRVSPPLQRQPGEMSRGETGAHRLGAGQWTKHDLLGGKIHSGYLVLITGRSGWI